MPLNREEQRRAEGYGYYTTYGSDASDVLNYVSNDLDYLQADRPNYYGSDGRAFKVTIIVEEL